MIQKVERFKTSDDRLFMSLLEAEFHERALAKKEEIEEFAHILILNQGEDLFDLAHFILENYTISKKD